MSKTGAECDTIGGFPFSGPCCAGCGATLLLENAWMTDGCPCNSPLGVNSMNETRWRLLMNLHEEQQARIASLEAEVAALQTELDSLRAIMDSEHETFLQELILTAYGNAPFGTDHAKVIADAKALLRTMEGGAV